jgi:hypothetical protein
MKHELVYVNEYRLHLDYSVEEGLKPFKEEVLDTLNCVHKDFDIESQMFSGGMDSTFILRSLLELGLTPRLHTLRLAKDQTDYESLREKDQCKKFGIKEPEFFYIDKYDLFKHIDILTYEKKIAFPTLHCYYVDYFLSKMGEEKFFCGMSCEYKTSKGFITMNVAPPAIKHFNPNRLYGFDSSKTFLSYVNNPIFKQNYLKENPIIDGYGENIWHIRDLIYKDCYSEIDAITKKSPDDSHISSDFCEHKLPNIKRFLPVIILMQPFKFNAEEYFKNKEKNSGS